jgi:hypothetical protein
MNSLHGIFWIKYADSCCKSKFGAELDDSEPVLVSETINSELQVSGDVAAPSLSLLAKKSRIGDVLVLHISNRGANSEDSNSGVIFETVSESSSARA